MACRSINPPAASAACSARSPAGTICSTICSRLGWTARGGGGTVGEVPPAGEGPVLDVCTGTADLALAYWRAGGGRVRVVGADFCRPMLVLGRDKCRERGAAGAVAAGRGRRPAAALSRRYVPGGLRGLRAAQPERSRTRAGRDGPRLPARRTRGRAGVLPAQRSRLLGGFTAGTSAGWCRGSARPWRGIARELTITSRPAWASFPRPRRWLERMAAAGLRQVRCQPRSTFGVATLIRGGQMKRNIVVAITGASGTPYAVRLIEVLTAAGCDVHLTISRAAPTVLKQELDLTVDLDALRAGHAHARQRRRASATKTAAVRAWPASPASPATCSRWAGASRARSNTTIIATTWPPSPAARSSPTGWSICPCSSGTLSAIVHGTSAQPDPSRGRSPPQGAPQADPRAPRNAAVAGRNWRTCGARPRPGP